MLLQLQNMLYLFNFRDCFSLIILFGSVIMKAFRKHCNGFMGIVSIRKFSGCSSCVGGCKSSRPLLNESIPPNQVGGSGSKGKSFDPSSFLKGGFETTKVSNRSTIPWQTAQYYDKESLEKVSIRVIFELMIGNATSF